MDIHEVKCKGFEDFLNKCTENGVRLVKMTTDAFTGPEDVGGGAISIVGKERMVLTAFIKKPEYLLLRWEETRRARSMVTIIANTGGKGFTLGDGYMGEMSTCKQRLEIEGIQVVEGEWTKQELEHLLEATA